MIVLQTLGVILMAALAWVFALCFAHHVGFGVMYLEGSKRVTMFLIKLLSGAIHTASGIIHRRARDGLSKTPKAVATEKEARCRSDTAESERIDSPPEQLQDNSSQ